MLKFDLFENYVVNKSLMNVINQMNMKRYLYCHLSTSPRKPYLITWQSNFTKVKIIFRIDHSYTQLPHVQTSGMIVKNSGFLGKSCRYQMQLEVLGEKGMQWTPLMGTRGKSHGHLSYTVLSQALKSLCNNWRLTKKYIFTLIEFQ